MKNLNLMICILFLGNFSAQAQWTKIESGTVSAFNSIHFPSNDIGYVVSSNGLVLKSYDTGATWQFLDSLKTNLIKVHFFDNNTGVIVSNSNKVFRTTDGGLNWMTDTVPEVKWIGDMFVLNQSIFLMSSNSTTIPVKILKSVDSGMTWNLIFESDSFYFRKIYFADSLTGFASSSSSNNNINQVFKTIDGGYNWVRYNYPKFQDYSNLTSISFSNKNIGFIGGWYSNYFIKTKDGGHNWQELKIAENETVPHIDFISTYKNVVYAGGIIIYRSLDFGETWARVSDTLQKIPLGVFDMHLFDEYNAVGVGFGGLIVRTTNGGGDDLLIDDKVMANNRIKVYPNPASDLLNIDIAEGLTVHKLDILSPDGKIVQTHNHVGNSVNTSGFKTGMYFLRFYSSEGVSTMKLIIE